MWSDITNEEWVKLDPHEVVKKRISFLEKIKEDQQKIDALKKYYEKNPIDFINDWMFTYDPRKKPAMRPFILFKRQRELIDYFQGRYDAKEDGIIEKSRTMGATWLSMAYAIWMWLFIRGSKISFGSRKESLVDRLGDPDSIFEKGRLIVGHLPNCFLPTDFDISKDMPFLRFRNHENGNVIAGEAGDNIGRGGRSSVYFIDEAAFLERADRIDAAVSENTEVQLMISTPNGTGNPFYRKRVGGKISVFTMHWRSHPEKDDEWYAKQCEKRSKVIIAQELDIDYNASVEDIFIPAEWVRASVDLMIPAEGEMKAGLDVADEGDDSNAMAIGKGSVIGRVLEKKEGNTTQTARWAYAVSRDNGVTRLNYDSIGVGAGIKGEMSVLDTDRIGLTVSGVNVGFAPTTGSVEPGKKNKDMFANLKAELWWTARKRFEATYKHVKGIKKATPDQMLSIPDDGQLINELSQPKMIFGENGKIKVESKKDMKKRGIKSPNKADALILYLAKGSGFFRSRTV